MGKLEDAFCAIREKTDFVPYVGLVLGSGLGDYASALEVIAEIDYAELPGFPVSTVAGHSGKFIFGYLGDVPMVCMKGRVHYYEGYPVSDVIMPIRLMKMMGAQILFLTNAAGGVSDKMVPGDLMMITDQIALFAPNPLIGPNMDSLGVRFPDMSKIYDEELCNVIRNAAKKHGVSIKEGIYTQLTGPSYETPAEIRLLKALGTDAVGMSTGVEAIVGRHAGMRVCGVSCISNMAAGISEHPLNHEEVQEAGRRAADKFTILVSESIHGFFSGLE